MKRISLLATTLPLALLLNCNAVSAFQTAARRPTTRLDTTIHTITTTTLHAAAKKQKKKGTVTTVASVIKGFGATIVSGRSDVETDRSKESRAFYEAFLEKQGAGDNIKRTALAFTNAQDTALKLRGVVCTRDIPKGSDIIDIPYELAFNVGPEGDDPTLPAVTFLRDYCRVLNSDSAGDDPKQHYYRMLPPYNGADCLGSTDFFSDAALEALQSPLIVEETLARRTKTAARFQRDIASDDTFPTWIDVSGAATPATAAHLQWAVWLITSRVLTVEGEQDSGQSYRLLIPYLDMCNHDRSSPHILTGRAVPGGKLRVVAGAAVHAGDNVNICYGGGGAGNDRFLQDYGFLDDAVEGYALVAQELLGKRRIREGANAGKSVSVADRERSLEALRATTIKQDEAALPLEVDPFVRTAIQYRLGVKKALSTFIAML